MKKILITLFFLLSITLTKAQADKAIASVYIKRAYDAIENRVDYQGALSYFEKAMQYTDTILDRKVATLGSLIYFEVHNKRPTDKERLECLEIAKGYCLQYFNLDDNISSEEYLSNTETFILIEENIEVFKDKIKKAEIERLKKEKELRKIDSLKTVWNNKSESLSIKVDSIYEFNKNNVALYSNNNFFGVISDLGEVAVEANEYVDALYFDGYFILKNKVEEPTKLFVYDSNSDIGYQIPSISDFNTLSTHFGKVMLPRGNGRLVTYPNNSQKPLVYDLKMRKHVKVANLEKLLNDLKKADVIDKYRKDLQVKINKNWYSFGGHIGGGIHPIYAEEGYNLEGFLCSIDGRFLKTSSDYQYIGAFYDNKLQAINGDETYWVNQNGTKVSEAKDEAKGYSGNSILLKLSNGSYQIIKDNLIILGEEKIEKLGDYLRKNADQE